MKVTFLATPQTGTETWTNRSPSPSTKTASCTLKSIWSIKSMIILACCSQKLRCKIRRWTQSKQAIPPRTSSNNPSSKRSCLCLAQSLPLRTRISPRMEEATLTLSRSTRARSCLSPPTLTHSSSVHRHARQLRLCRRATSPMPKTASHWSSAVKCTCRCPALPQITHFHPGLRWCPTGANPVRKHVCEGCARSKRTYSAYLASAT